MASLEPGKYKGRRAPTGYNFRTSNSGRDIYTPVNELNRSNRIKRNPGSMGGGRSNLDNQRGFSNQGNRNTGGNRPNTYIDPRSRYASGISNTSVSDPREEFIMNRDVFEETPSGYDKEYKNIAFNLPSLKLMKGIGDGIQNIGRGSRLQGMYQDRAVADGRSKSSGYQDFKNEKMNMMTQKDEDFYNKYINLANMAQDNEKRDEYKKTAESAWRNQQTTDRLSMVSGFEDYRPEKYESYDYPGRGRMEEVATLNGYDVFNPLPGSGRSMASGQDAIDSQMNYEDITESIVTDTNRIRPKVKPPLPIEEENLEGLTYNQRFNEDLNANPYNDFFNQPGNNAFPPQTQKKIPSYLNNGLGFFDENEDGEQYYRY
mgnify:CR=1 FL=1